MSEKGESKTNFVSRDNEANIHFTEDSDDRMNWAIEKANYTLYYFEDCLKAPKSGQTRFSIKVNVDNEHIWLSAPEFDSEGNLFGVVENEPLHTTTVKKNQKIGLDKGLISDWIIEENGRLIGGYTIRAIRDGYTGDELKEFDSTLGMIIDEGEDYFKADFNTPEGAILCLEDAYNTHNADSVIACMNFFVEASVMLHRMGLGTQITEESLEKTANILQNTFLKRLMDFGFPSFTGIKRAFPVREKISNNYFIITEVCYFPDGRTSIQKLHTYLTQNGWRVINTY